MSRRDADKAKRIVRQQLTDPRANALTDDQIGELTKAIYVATGHDTLSTIADILLLHWDSDKPRSIDDLKKFVGICVIPYKHHVWRL
jgi:hypothetical protein